MTMIIHGSAISPFVRKAVAFATLKGVDFEHKQTPPHSDDAEFTLASPFGKIPALCDGDFRFSDSSAIAHYLEAKFPEPGLIPADPMLRAKTIWYEEIADTVIAGAVFKTFGAKILPMLMGGNGDPEAAAKAAADELPRICGWLENQITGSDYLVGDSISLADLAVVAPFRNFHWAGFPLDAAAYPKLAKYVANIEAMPCFAATIVPSDGFMNKFLGVDA